MKTDITLHELDKRLDGLASSGFLELAKVEPKGDLSADIAQSRPASNNLLVRRYVAPSEPIERIYGMSTRMNRFMLDVVNTMGISYDKDDALMFTQDKARLYLGHVPIHVLVATQSRVVRMVDARFRPGDFGGKNSKSFSPEDYRACFSIDPYPFPSMIPDLVSGKLKPDDNDSISFDVLREYKPDLR